MCGRQVCVRGWEEAAREASNVCRRLCLCERQAEGADRREGVRVTGVFLV